MQQYDLQGNVYDIQINTSHEKTAKEMFEALGYKLTLETKRTICYDINNELERRAIWFVIPSKRFIIGAYQYTTTKELKAINQQCKELGWLDE